MIDRPNRGRRKRKKQRRGLRLGLVWLSWPHRLSDHIATQRRAANHTQTAGAAPVDRRPHAARERSAPLVQTEPKSLRQSETDGHSGEKQGESKGKKESNHRPHPSIDRSIR